MDSAPDVGTPQIAPSPEFEKIAAGTRFRDRIVRHVDAPATVTFEALHNVTLSEMPVAWFLGEVRYLPMRLLGQLPPAAASEPFLQTLLAHGTLVLHESPAELVTGSAARLHRVDQQPVHFLSRDAFEQFADVRFQKLFISIRVVPCAEGRSCWLVLEHATRALSPSAERAFARYWRLIRPVGGLVTGLFLRAIARRAEQRVRSGAVWSGRSLTPHWPLEVPHLHPPGTSGMRFVVASGAHGPLTVTDLRRHAQRALD